MTLKQMYPFISSPANIISIWLALEMKFLSSFTELKKQFFVVNLLLENILICYVAFQIAWKREHLLLSVVNKSKEMGVCYT